MRSCVRVMAVAAGCLATGCVTVPPLEGYGVPISEVVQRIKCELVEAVPDPEQQDRLYRWMRNWTAKVDLGLTIEDKSGLTPSVSIIDLREQAVIPRVGTFGQSLTLGAGAGVNTTATRDGSISFTLSLKELRQTRQESWCQHWRGAGLTGDLGLKEWIAAALEPVESCELTTGTHRSPGGGSKRRGRSVRALADLPPEAPLPRCPTPRTKGKDPPLDSISHQVQFVVALNANVAPNWILARFRGPSASGNLAAISRTKTHTLQVVLGAPQGEGRDKTSNEQARQLLRQDLQRSLRLPLQ